MPDKNFAGKLLILSFYNGIDDYEPLACLTSNSMAETMSMLESTTKCDNGRRKILPDTYSANHSFEGELIDTTTVGGNSAKLSWDSIKDKFRKGEEIAWKLHTITWNNSTVNPVATDDGFIREYGKGYLSDLELTGDLGEFITFSGTLEINGAISQASTIPNES